MVRHKSTVDHDRFCRDISLDEKIPILTAEVADAETVLALELSYSRHSLAACDTVSNNAETELHPAYKVAAVSKLYRVLFASCKRFLACYPVESELVAFGDEDLLQALYLSVVLVSPRA